MKRQEIPAFLVMLLLTLVIPGQASAGIIFFDDFEQEHLGLNYDGFRNWTVRNGSVDVIGSAGGAQSFDFLAGQGRGLYVDMDGTTRDAGRLVSRRAFEFLPGHRYTLSFDLAGSQRQGHGQYDRLRVTVGDIASETFRLPWFQEMQTYATTFSVQAPTSARLAFGGLGRDNVGLLLDNVRLFAAPLPGAAWLLGLGMAGLLGLRRRL